MGVRADRSVALIQSAWDGVTSEAEAEACVKRMIDTPSVAWRAYLDQLHLASNDSMRATSEIDKMRLQVLARYEDELYASVAEAIAAEDGLATQ